MSYIGRTVSGYQSSIHPQHEEDIQERIQAEFNLGKDTQAAAEAVSGTALTGAMLAAGALVEYGENSNGSYWRWESGLQICAHTLLMGDTSSLGNGSLDNMYRSVEKTWVFAASFYELIGVALSSEFDGRSGSKAMHLLSYRRHNNNQIEAIQALSGTMLTDVDILARLTAIGRWK